MTILDNIKHKISALLAKAQGTDNEHEAEIFLQKAYELLDQHQIQIWELRNEEDPMGEDFAFDISTAAPVWKNKLLLAVARYYGATTVRTWKAPKLVKDGGRYVYRRTDYSVNVVGRESARITTLLMYPFIVKQTRELAKDLSSKGVWPYQVDKLQLRICNALCDRIHLLVQDRDNKKDGSSSRALVVVDELEKFLEKTIPNLGTVRSGRRITSTAAREAAQKVSLHRQTSAEHQLKIESK